MTRTPSHLPCEDPATLEISGFTPWKIVCWTEAGCPSNGEIEEILQIDPALVFQTLRIANSPFYGIQRKVSTLPHARALLGCDPLKGLILGAAMRLGSPTGTVELAPDPEAFWAHSMHVAFLTRLLARRTGYDLPEEAYVAGLLHDIGKRLTGGPATRRGRGAHARAAGAAARRCHFPRGLSAAIAHHHDSPRRAGRLAPKTRKLTALIGAADYLANRWRAERNGDPSGLESHPGRGFLAELGIGATPARDLLLTSEESLVETLRCSRLGPETLEDIYRESSARREIELDQDLFPQRGESLSSTIQFINQAAREIRQKSSRDEVIEAVLALLHRNLGFDRALYFDYNRNGRNLVLTHGIEDTNFTRSADGVRLALGNGERRLSRVLRTSGGSLVRDPSQDNAVLDFFGVPEIGIAPVVVKGQPIGLLTIDQFSRGTPIGEREVGILELLAGKVGVILENLELTHQGKKLRRIAEKDALTGINNRRYCLDLIRKEIDRARRYAAPLSLVLIDLDHFKEFNDLYGHPAGDRVLRDVARLIESNSRKTDVIGRFGGDEFLVILPQITSDQAITYAERVRTRVAEFGRALKKLYPRCNLAISIGVASWKKGDRIDQLISTADKALYAAKERGRNRVCSTD
jgi:diguanylate cyclase (GGDEF)-like protein/putative nucleotidyltransferase with HDIG domain